MQTDAADSTPPAIRAEVMAKAVAGQPIYDGTVLSNIRAARRRASEARARARKRVTPSKAKRHRITRPLPRCLPQMPPDIQCFKLWPKASPMLSLPSRK